MTETLTPRYIDGTWTVTDAEGGVWWPHEPEPQTAEEALRRADQEPMTGTWKS